jgi:hypothetical protein
MIIPSSYVILLQSLCRHNQAGGGFVVSGFLEGRLKVKCEKLKAKGCELIYYNGNCSLD